MWKREEREIGHNFPDDIFNLIFLYENYSISIEISLNFHQNYGNLLNKRRRSNKWDVGIQTF